MIYILKTQGTIHLKYVYFIIDKLYFNIFQLYADKKKETSSGLMILKYGVVHRKLYF